MSITFGSASSKSSYFSASLLYPGFLLVSCLFALSLLSLSGIGAGLHSSQSRRVNSLQEQTREQLDQWATQQARFEEELAQKLELSLLKKAARPHSRASLSRNGGGSDLGEQVSLGLCGASVASFCFPFFVLNSSPHLFLTDRLTVSILILLTREMGLVLSYLFAQFIFLSRWLLDIVSASLYHSFLSSSHSFVLKAPCFTASACGCLISSHAKPATPCRISQQSQCS